MHTKFPPDEWIWSFFCIHMQNVLCFTATESAPFYTAGQFQLIVGISGANHCRGIFRIACLVLGVF